MPDISIYSIPAQFQLCSEMTYGVHNYNIKYYTYTTWKVLIETPHSYLIFQITISYNYNFIPQQPRRCLI